MANQFSQSETALDCTTLGSNLRFQLRPQIKFEKVITYIIFYILYNIQQLVKDLYPSLELYGKKRDDCKTKDLQLHHMKTWLTFAMCY